LIRGADGSDVFVAVAGAVGDKPPAPQGRFLVVGDPSIVMNSMLRYAGNKAFARGLVRYAVENDSWGTRGGRLFVASGAFEQKGSFGGEENTVAEWLRLLEDAFDIVRNEGLPDPLAWAAAI